MLTWRRSTAKCRGVLTSKPDVRLSRSEPAPIRTRQTPISPLITAKWRAVAPLRSHHRSDFPKDCEEMSTNRPCHVVPKCAEVVLSCEVRKKTRWGTFEMSEQQNYEQLGWVGWKGQDGSLTAFLYLL